MKIHPIASFLGAVCLAATTRVDAAVLEYNRPALAGPVATDASGTLYMATETPFDPSTSRDVLLHRMNADGTIGATFRFGGSDTDTPLGLAADAEGSVYVVGTTRSTDFPVVNAYQAARSGANDLFVLKYRWGTGVVYATYLGTPVTDLEPAIAVDTEGSAHVAWTNNVEPADELADWDGFVAKLSPAGNVLLYTRPLEFSARDTANAITIDAQGRAHVVGMTRSPEFPVVNPIQATHAGTADAFLMTLSTDGEIVASTFLGGSLVEVASAVAVDAQGHTYVAGETNSSNFPVTAAFQPALRGFRDAFVAKVLEGDRIVWSTYFGGDGFEMARAIGLDAQGGVHVAGFGEPAGFPWRRRVQAPEIDQHMLVARFEADGGLDHASLVGDDSTARWLALDPAGRAYVNGDVGDSRLVKLLPSERREQNDASVSYPRGEWTTADVPGASGGTVAQSSEPGAAARVAFEGTGVSLIGRRSASGGRALVYVDDGAHLPPGRAEFYGPEQVDVPVFNITGLAPGTHTLTLYVSSEAGLGGGHTVTVDAFEIVAGTGTIPAPTPTGSPTGTPTPTPSATRLEQDAATYEGAWFTNTHPVHSGGSAVAAMDAGDRATLSFTGTGVTWIGYTDDWSGIARVLVDGTLRATVDTYSSPQQSQKRLFSITGLTSGPHTLTIEVTGTRGAASAGNWVWIDAFEVVSGGGGGTPTPTGPPTMTPTPTPTASGSPTATPTPATTRVEQGAATYEGAWFTNTHPVHSGGSAVAAMDAGDRATLAFNGTGVTWIGYTDDWSGIARVLVDGTLRGTIDTYSSPQQSRKPLFSVAGLAPGAHTLTIEVTGTRNAASGGSWVWIDAFDVTTGGSPTPTPTPSPTGMTPTPTPTSPTPGATPTATPPPSSRVEQDAAAYQGTWFANNHPVHSGGSAVTAMDPGDRATFTFNGTGVSWIGYTDDWSGIARVLVDGTLRGMVDTYSSPQSAQKRLFSLSGLPAGPHTLTIEATGTRNAASGGQWIWIDAFEVAP